MATHPSCRSGLLYAATSIALTFGARAEADVTLHLSKPAYEVGELVSFTLTNESKWRITLPHVIGWWQVYDWQGNLVGGCPVQPTEVDLYPGYSFTDNWDQLLCPDGPQVPQGRYRLKVTYRSECCPGMYFSVEVFFNIGMVPVQPTSWGRVKTLFRGH